MIFIVLGSYTLYTILPPRILSVVSVRVLTFSFPSTNFGPVLEFAELPILDPVSELHAAALLLPAL